MALPALFRMQPRALVWFIPSLCSCLDVSTDAPIPYWIISCNDSLIPDDMIYLERGGDGDGALQSWKMDYRKPDKTGKFLLYPGDDDAYYIIGDYDSRAAGFMLYLDNSGAPQVWPFNPDAPDQEAAWRIIPYDGNDEQELYFIVSGPKARYPNQMLYPTELLGLQIAAFNAKELDPKSTFAFYPAPPSPPIDFDAVAEEHTRMVYLFNIVIPVAFICVCCCIYVARKRERTYAKDGFTSSIFGFPAMALKAMPWNRYQQVDSSQRQRESWSPRWGGSP